MTVRGFGEKTRHDYVRHVRTFSAFIGRSPDTATAEEVRRFQLHQTTTGVGAPSINSAVSALRFLFSVTLERPDLARRLTVVRQPRKLPLVLSAKEVALLLEAAPGPKYKAALSSLAAFGRRPSCCWRCYDRLSSETLHKLGSWLPLGSTAVSPHVSSARAARFPRALVGP